MTKNRTTTRPPSTSTKTSCFLGCFGSSGDKTRDEVNSVSPQRRWRSKWSLIRFKKPPTKTVPVDLTTAKSANDAPTTPGSTWEIQVVEENATLTKKHVEGNHVPVTSDEKKPRRKKWTVAVKSQNGSYRSRQKETKAAVTSAPGPGLGLPEQKPVTAARPFVSPPLKTLTQSKSPPLPKRQKPEQASLAGGGVNRGVLHRTPPSGGEFNSLIGLSIILVILVIMLLWGRLCAILCTSAWFFIAPRLVPARERSAVAMAGKRQPESRNNLDLESEEYKKKVILEGLLQRNNRNIVGVGQL